MATLNTNTKKAQTIIDGYFGSFDKSVWDCYTRPSFRKCAIESGIIQDMHNCGGYDYRVISHNSNIFTCAFRYDVIGDETGESKFTVLRYYSPSQTLEMILD